MESISTESGYFPPGSREYDSATSPHNSSGSQRPSVVARPTDAQHVADAILYARDRGLAIAVQATGHGAAGDIDDRTLLIDTAALDDVSIDVGNRVARAGSGATWAAVNAAAEKHGLLGLAGSSPSVGVSGYTFGGGVGWLTRPHGLASSHLRAVDWVDLDGRIRRATDDAADGRDRDVLWAFRGGNGMGVAIALEFDLLPAPALHAGFLLWPADALPEVARAWSASLTRSGDHLTTSLAVLQAPPSPPFPAELQGSPVVHLAVASATGGADAAALFAALDHAPAPVLSTWGPADAERLAGIHLDPPVAVPAIGDGRWLDETAGSMAEAILSVALDDESPIRMVELRYVANPDPGTVGAMTTVPGPFLLHAVGAPGDATERDALDQALARLRAVSARADIGRSAPSFSEGTRRIAEALTPSDLARRHEVSRSLDPDRILRAGRDLV